MITPNCCLARMVEVTEAKRRDFLGPKLREKGIVGPLLLHNLKENNKIEAPCILESRDVSNQEMAMETSKVICRCVSVPTI